MSHYTLNSEDPKQIRTQVVDTLLEQVSAEVGAYFSVYRAEGEDWYFGEGVYRGPDQGMIDKWLNFATGRPAPESPWLPPFVDETVLNRFVRLRRHYEEGFLTQFSSYDNFIVPAEVGDQLRAIVVDGNRVLGWLGVARRGFRERFRSGEERVLQRKLPSLSMGLMTARTLEEEDWGEDECCAVFGAEGKVEHGSRGFARRFEQASIDEIGRAVRALDEEALKARECLLVGHLKVRLIRLDGAGGVRYMARVEKAKLAEINPRSWLTERQREVVDYAVAGATAREIATTLEISRHTVKTHLKSIYQRLNVASRVELVQLLGDSSKAR